MAFQGKKLINDPNDVVTEFIKGLVETYPRLRYLDGFPEVKVVLRADVSSATYDKVAIISGGGGGHEPAHAGYVGEGMLTAAICGDVFASPPVDSILAGIRAVTGSMGCLLIVKNYNGDRLNFGLAAEQAKSEGYKVETVIVGDDCASHPPQGIAERRGLAGTILVHKVAGAAAAAGLLLADVAAEAKRASEMVGTMSVALSVCTLPGQVTSDRLSPGKMELGLGIHGEPGAAMVDIQPVDVVVSRVLNQILSPETKYVPITRGNRVVLMINGLGATPIMELMIASGKAVPELQLEHGLAVDRVYTGSFMTSLDTAGFSISIMKADETILQRLDAATKAPYWPVGVNDIRTQAPAGNVQIIQVDGLDGLEILQSTMSFGLVIQTLSLLDATQASIRNKVFSLGAIATAEFAFVCWVLSLVLKRRTSKRKLADGMLLASIGLDILCVLFQAGRRVPVFFMPVVYSAGLLVFVIVVILYRNYKM